MAQPARNSAAAGLGAVVLLAVGVLCAVLYVIANDHENHSFNANPTPPALVHITAGQQYEISTPGGIDALHKKGIDQSALSCSFDNTADLTGAALTITALDNDSRTTHTVATFIAPVTGLVHITCPDLGATFIDDADNGSADPAGLFMLLCVITLTAGAALGLSVLYRRPPRPGPDRRPVRWTDDDPGPAGDAHDRIFAPAPWAGPPSDTSGDISGDFRPNRPPLDGPEAVDR